MPYALPPDLAALRRQALKRRRTHQRWAEQHGRAPVVSVTLGRWYTLRDLGFDHPARSSMRCSRKHYLSGEGLTWKHEGGHKPLYVFADDALLDHLRRHFIPFRAFGADGHLVEAFLSSTQDSAMS